MSGCSSCKFFWKDVIPGLEVTVRWFRSSYQFNVCWLTTWKMRKSADLLHWAGLVLFGCKTQFCEVSHHYHDSYVVADAIAAYLSFLSLNIIYVFRDTKFRMRWFPRDYSWTVSPVSTLPAWISLCWVLEQSIMSRAVSSGTLTLLCFGCWTDCSSPWGMWLACGLHRSWLQFNMLWNRLK